MRKTVVDPYKNRLKHILDNSKIAKEARLTALKVKALEAIKPRPSNGKLYAEKGLINLSRRDSTDSVGSFSHSLLRRNRGLSVPNSRNQSADLSRTMNVFKRLSLPAGTVYHSGRHSERETCFSPSRMDHFDRRSFSATEVNGQRARALSEIKPKI